MITRKLFLALGIAVMVFLLFSQGWAQTQPKPGTRAPVITHSYAIEKGRYGDVVKIFIEANDPDTDMFRIAVVVDQAGYGRYPADWIYLKPQNRNHFIGYMEWSTYSSKTIKVREWTQVNIKVSVFDRAGNESNVVVFPFEFVSEVISNPSPPAPFNQGNIAKLGNMDVNLFEPAIPLFPD